MPATEVLRLDAQAWGLVLTSIGAALSLVAGVQATRSAAAAAEARSNTQDRIGTQHVADRLARLTYVWRDFSDTLAKQDAARAREVLHTWSQLTSEILGLVRLSHLEAEDLADALANSRVFANATIGILMDEASDLRRNTTEIWNEMSRVCGMAGELSTMLVGQVGTGDGK